ncbi:MAG: glycosyltransferase family 39 protein [Isosphaeraceae bacterium]|nr:glycosyltransferase family 39 protein [Isosphaeraceae bacterium]
MGIVVLAVAVRLAAAWVVQGYVDRKGTICVFGDTTIYWLLSERILTGESYEVDQLGMPHRALRTPGYPAFLAICRSIVGDRPLGVRIIQAILNGTSVALVAALALVLFQARSPADRRRAALFAALLAAIDPYAAGISVLILSEAAFFPLMLLGLIGAAGLSRSIGSESSRGLILPGIATGIAMAAAVLVRPSWAIFPPFWCVVLLATAGAERARALRVIAIVGLTASLVMFPWWIRNARVIGRFVPTALWVGASLYDGIRPTADGSSDMRFLEDPEIARLDEVDQDRELRRRAIDYATRHPGRVLELAALKAARFFSPWPNAETLKSGLVDALSSIWTLPTYFLVMLGAIPIRRDPRALVVLLGPLVCFLGLHIVFVSSIRYRVPGMLPAYALAGYGLVRVVSRLGGERLHEC